MEPMPSFDPTYFAGRSRRRRRIRRLAAMVVLLSLSGLALRAGPIPARRPASPPIRIASRTVVPAPAQGGAANPRAAMARPRDRFVIPAPAEIDPAMVVHARDDIDPEMVFNPETGRRGSRASGRAPVLVTPAPDEAPPR